MSNTSQVRKRTKTSKTKTPPELLARYTKKIKPPSDQPKRKMVCVTPEAYATLSTLSVELSTSRVDIVTALISFYTTYNEGRGL